MKAKTKTRQNFQAVVEEILGKLHDSKTAISLAKIFVEKSNNPGNFARYMKCLGAEIEKSFELITEILKRRDQYFNGYSSFESKEPFNLRFAIDNILESFETSAREKGIGFLVGSKLDIPDMAIGFPGIMQTGLMNLISNSIKYTEKGYVHVDFKIENETKNDFILRFIVSDTGIGIKENLSIEIRNGFVKSQIDTENKLGFGIGLSYTNSIIESVGGTFKMEPALNHGSIFQFTLPFKKIRLNPSKIAVHCKVQSNEMVPNYWRGKNILIAEDNEFARELLFDSFISLNEVINIDVAKNGKEALKYATEKNYHVIILDNQLGDEIRGIDIVNVISNLPDSRKPEISVSISGEDSNSMIEAGFHFCIDKSKIHLSPQLIAQFHINKMK